MQSVVAIKVGIYLFFLAFCNTRVKVKALMALESWKEISWWNKQIENGLLNIHCGTNTAQQVQKIREVAGKVKQQNCQVVPFEIFVDGNEGSKINVVVKEVYLPLANFRSLEHQQRTRKSHLIETIFYSDYAPKIDETKIKVPKIFMSHWVSEELLILIEEDVRTTLEINNETGRGMEQRIFLAMDEIQMAMYWLASWHSSFYELSYEKLEGNSQLWKQGGYWTFEKRQADFHMMDERWEATCQAFLPVDDVYGTPQARGLATTLRDLASTLDGILKGQTEGQTLLHGDFKTANLFFRDADGMVAAVDYQWVGRGLCVQDLVYVLFCSVDPDVIFNHEEELVAYYYQRLQENLQSNGKEPLPFERFLEQYEIAFLDYVRYLISTMWGNFSPEKAAALRGHINHGMQKREPALMTYMIKKAINLLEKLDLQQKVPRTLRLAESAIVLAESAGKIIKDIIAEGTHVSSATDKGYKTEQQNENGAISNPQTIADITAERHIIQSFKELFPDVLVIGEEMMETGPQTGEGIEVPALACRFGYSGLDLVALAQSLPDDLKDIDFSEITIWVDPLDGTKEMLLSALENVTTLIGIAFKGRPIFGVIHQPFGGQFGRTFVGGLCAGQAAFWRDCPLSPMSKIIWKDELKPNVDFSNIVVSSSRRPIPPEVDRILPAPMEIVQHGGAGRHYLELIEQRTTLWVHINGKASRWDTCAGEAILGALGGITKDRINRCDYMYLKPDPEKPETFKNLGGVVSAASPTLLEHFYQTQIPAQPSSSKKRDFTQACIEEK